MQSTVKHYAKQVVIIIGVASPIFLGVNTLGGAKHLTLGEQQHFCFGRRFLKQEMTRLLKILGGNGHLAAPMVKCTVL